MSPERETGPVGGEEEPANIEPSCAEIDPWSMPQIYVASLTDYNAGILHGDWIHAHVGVDIVQEVIDEMLADSPTAMRTGETAEEWAIHDFCGFGPVHLTEHEPLERVCAIAEGITNRGEAYAAWVASQDDAEPSPSVAFGDQADGASCASPAPATTGPTCRAWCSTRSSGLAPSAWSPNATDGDGSASS